MKNAFSFFFKTIVESKFWIGYVSFVFLVGIVSGIIVSLVNPDLTREFFAGYGESVQKITSQRGLGSMLLIFERNASIMIVALLLSLFGIVPTLVIFVNGVVFGMIFGFREIYESFSALEIAVLIIPHGIIEITATLLGLGIATRAGVRWVFGKNRRETLFRDFAALSRMSFFVVGLLFIAAFLEAFVTPALSCLIFRICF